MKNHIYSIIFFVVLLGIGKNTLATSLEEDSLWSSWVETELPDSMRLSSFEKLINVFYIKDYSDTSIILSNQLIDFASDINDIDFEIKGRLLLIRALSKGGQKAQAFNNIESLDKLLNGISNNSLRAQSYRTFGSVYLRYDDFQLAGEYIYKGLELYEKIADQDAIAKCNEMLGKLHYEQKDFEPAKSFFYNSSQIYKSVNNDKGLALAYNSLGRLYKKEQKSDSALYFFNKSLSLLENLGDTASMLVPLGNIARIYANNEDFKKAMEITLRIEHHYKRTGNNKGICSVLINKAKIKKAMGDLNKAILIGEEALVLAHSIKSPKAIRVASSLLSNFYYEIGNYKRSIDLYKLHIKTRDEMLSEENQKALIQQEYKFEYDKKKALDDAAHDKQLAIEKEEKQKQKIISTAIGIGLLLVMVFSVFIFNRLRVTRKQKIVIEMQRDEVEEAHKEIRDSINYAERIQRSFLATDELLSSNLKDYFVFFQPKDVVSGDFYWAGKLANDQFAIVNADSTGHGVPGAIMSILNISSIEKAIDEGLTRPHEIFNHTRMTIIERLKKDGSLEGGKDGMDASLIIFDFVNNCFNYTAAQNPIWIVRGGELIEIKGEKMPIGKHDNDSVPFIGGAFNYQKGDVIYTLTDGFQDQFGGDKGKKFKVKPFKNYLISIAHLPMQEQKVKLKETFFTWMGTEEQVDDVCVIGIRV